jgi:hypothetical protein
VAVVGTGSRSPITESFSASYTNSRPCSALKLQCSSENHLTLSNSAASSRPLRPSHSHRVRRASLSQELCDIVTCLHLNCYPCLIHPPSHGRRVSTLVRTSAYTMYIKFFVSCLPFCFTRVTLSRELCFRETQVSVGRTKMHASVDSVKLRLHNVQKKRYLEKWTSTNLNWK